MVALLTAFNSAAGLRLARATPMLSQAYSTKVMILHSLPSAFWTPLEDVTVLNLMTGTVARQT